MSFLPPSRSHVCHVQKQNPNEMLCTTQYPNPIPKGPIKNILGLTYQVQKFASNLVDVFKYVHYALLLTPQRRANDGYIYMCLSYVICSTIKQHARAESVKCIFVLVRRDEKKKRHDSKTGFIIKLAARKTGSSLKYVEELTVRCLPALLYFQTKYTLSELATLIFKHPVAQTVTRSRFEAKKFRFLLVGQAANKIVS